MANAIIFDTETNGLTPDCSVLSITAIKIDSSGEELEVFDRCVFHAIWTVIPVENGSGQS